MTLHALVALKERVSRQLTHLEKSDPDLASLLHDIRDEAALADMLCIEREQRTLEALALLGETLHALQKNEHGERSS